MSLIMSLLPYHKGNKTNFINLLFTLTRFSEEFVFVIHMLYICDIIYNEKDYEYGSS